VLFSRFIEYNRDNLPQSRINYFYIHVIQPGLSVKMCKVDEINSCVKALTLWRKNFLLNFSTPCI